MNAGVYGSRSGMLLAASLIALAGAGCATNSGVNREDAATANASLASDLLSKNDNVQAENYFRKALSYDSHNFDANWGMAVVSARQGETDQADDYYRRTLAVRPRPEVYNSYAAFLCEQGKTDQAVAYFQHAAATQGYANADAALANAGLCLHRANRDAAAAGYFRQALAVNPSQPIALTQMAAIEYAGHDYLHARAFIERADAVTALDADQLLLAARIELAMNDPSAAESYIQRHNASQPTTATSLRQLEQSR